MNQHKARCKKEKQSGPAWNNEQEKRSLATFIGAGSLLDHVYVKNNFQTIGCSILPVYYYDHDAVKISIF